jgi:hypothetical protein
MKTIYKTYSEKFNINRLNIPNNLNLTHIMFDDYKPYCRRVNILSILRKSYEYITINKCRKVKYEVQTKLKFWLQKYFIILLDIFFFFEK